MRRLIIAALALAMAGPAFAFWHGVQPVGTCSNSLDFSQACNSAYIAVIF